MYDEVEVAWVQSLRDLWLSWVRNISLAERAIHATATSCR